MWDFQFHPFILSPDLATLQCSPDNRDAYRILNILVENALSKECKNDTLVYATVAAVDICIYLYQVLSESCRIDQDGKVCGRPDVS